MERIGDQMRRDNAGGSSSFGGGRLPPLQQQFTVQGRGVPTQESRLVNLLEEVTSAIELSIRHQEALWGIVILNSHEGPFHSDAIPPSLLPNLHAKMDASIEFSQLALLRLQELRGFLADFEALTRSDTARGFGLAPPAPELRTEGAAVARPQLGPAAGAFTAREERPGHRTASTGAAGAGSSNPVALPPKPVRPSAPLAPLKVPVRPAAFPGASSPSPELSSSSRGTTPAVYTAYRGNTDTRAMATASFSPRTDVVVPPSFFASPFPPETGHVDFPAFDSSVLEMLLGNLVAPGPTGAETASSTDNTLDASSRNSSFNVTTALPQPSTTTWLNSGPSTQATGSATSPAELDSGFSTPRRPTQGRLPRAGSLRRKQGLQGERVPLQHGANPSKDIPSDGYCWRKYGQKSIRNSNHERCYYRCSGIDEGQSTPDKKVPCKGKKQVQRSDDDPSMFIVCHRSEHTCGASRGRENSDGGRRRGDVVHAPQPRRGNLPGVAARLHSALSRLEPQQGMEAQAPLHQQGVEAQAPLHQVHQQGLERTSETGTSESSMASDFLLDNEQDFGRLPDLPPLISDGLWVEDRTAGPIPLEEMKSLLLGDDMEDSAQARFGGGG